MHARAVAFLLLVATASVPAAGAFTSFPPGSSVHEAIVADAVTSFEFPGKASQALQVATRQPDYDESKVTVAADGSVTIHATDLYSPAHHCDRVPPMADAQAFQQTADYVAQQRQDALARLRAGEAQASMEALGRALHALEDCFSHSNVVDLGVAAERAHQRAVVGDGPPVQGLRLTGFDPQADDPTAPPGDPFSHRDHNLDSSNGSAAARVVLADNNTRFEHARQDAIAASRLFLGSFLGNVTPEQRAALMDVHAKETLRRFPIPGSLVPATALVVALAAVCTRRRR